MPDRIIAVGEGGSIYQRDYGSRYYADAFFISQIPCDVPGQTCAQLLGQPLPTLDATVPRDILTLREASLAAELSQPALAGISVGVPVPAIVQAQNVAAYLPGGLPQLLREQPAVAAAIDTQVQEYIAERRASPDPYALITPADRLTGVSTLELFEDTTAASFTAERAAANDAAVVEAAGRLSVGIFGDAFGSSSSALAIPTFFPSPTPSFDAFGSPLIGFDPGAIFSGGDMTFGSGLPPLTDNGGGGIDSGGGSGSLIEALLATAVGAIPALARAGVIRGSVGKVFAGGGSVGASPMTMTTPQPAVQGRTGMALSLNDALQALVMSANANVGLGLEIQDDQGRDPFAPKPMPFGTNGCGSRTKYVDMMTAPGLYRMGCRGFQPASKVIAQNPDGSRSLFMNIGKIIAPSQKALQRAARTLARQAHCRVSSTSSSRSRYTRRVYRRRRPR